MGLDRFSSRGSELPGVNGHDYSICCFLPRHVDLAWHTAALHNYSLTEG